MKKLIFLGSTAISMLLLTGCNQHVPTTQVKTNSPSSQINIDNNVSDSSTSQTYPNTSNSTTSTTPRETETIRISVEEALKYYQKEYPNTTITSLKLDNSFGDYYYEIDGADDLMKYGIKIHAINGELKKDREEPLDPEDQNGVERKNDGLSLAGILSRDKVTNIALESVGSGEAIEWKLDRELLTTYWEVTVLNGSSETSVKMDAETGKLLGVELDD